MVMLGNDADGLDDTQRRGGRRLADDFAVNDLRLNLCAGDCGQAGPGRLAGRL